MANFYPPIYLLVHHLLGDCKFSLSALTPVIGKATAIRLCGERGSPEKASNNPQVSLCAIVHDLLYCAGRLLLLVRLQRHRQGAEQRSGR